MARSQWTTYTVRTDAVTGLGWAVIAEHLGYRSVGAWLAALAEARHQEFVNAGYEAAARRREQAALTEDERAQHPLAVSVRRAYVWEAERLYQLALATPELHPSHFHACTSAHALSRMLFEEHESATLIAEHRARIAGVLNALLDPLARAARVRMLAVRPEWRRHGVGTALYAAFRDLLPRERPVHVSAYVPLDTPALAFFERLGFMHGRQCVWMERTT